MPEVVCDGTKTRMEGKCSEKIFTTGTVEETDDPDYTRHKRTPLKVSSFYKTTIAAPATAEKRTAAYAPKLKLIFRVEVAALEVVAGELLEAVLEALLLTEDVGMFVRVVPNTEVEVVERVVAGTETVDPLEVVRPLLVVEPIEEVLAELSPTEKLAVVA